VSEMVIEQPRAGWYPDPTSAAPYRWWDGDRWSLRTTDDPATAEIPQLAFAAPLPSRRALREHESNTPGLSAPDRAAAEPAEAPDFVPLNPLVARRAPQSPGTPDFTAPESWMENSATSAVTDYADYAVYGTGAPFAATISRPQDPAPVNSFANLGAGFAVIGLLYQAVIAVWGADAATSYAGLAVAAALVAGTVLGVIGMARADRFTPRGARVQRAPGLLVVLVCLVALAAQVAVALGILVPTGVHDLHLNFAVGA
jgi:hypothetical protein